MEKELEGVLVEAMLVMEEEMDELPEAVVLVVLLIILIGKAEDERADIPVTVAEVAEAKHEEILCIGMEKMGVAAEADDERLVRQLEVEWEYWAEVQTELAEADIT